MTTVPQNWKLDKKQLPWAFLPLGMALMLWWMFSPGSTNSDTIDMLNQAVTGHYRDWHSPLLSMVWSIFPSATGALASTFLFNFIIFPLSTIGIAYLCGAPFRSACFIATLALITPAVLGVMSCLCKDTLVADLFLASVYFSLLGKNGSWKCAIIKIILLTLAVLVRPEFIIIAVLYLMSEAFLGRPRCLRCGFVSSISVILGVFLVTHVLYPLKKVAQVYPQQFIYLGELVDLSVHSHSMLVPEPFRNHLSIEDLQRSYADPDVTRCFWPAPGNESDVHIKLCFGSADYLHLEHVWFQAALSHPGEEVAHRGRLLARYLWEGSYFSSGIDENTLGIQAAHPAAQKIGIRYLYLFLREPFHRHFVAFLFGPFVMFYLLKKASPERRLLVIALICGFMYQCLFCLILGLPAYFRFGAAGLVLSWISLYIVIFECLASRSVWFKQWQGKQSLFVRNHSR